MAQYEEGEIVQTSEVPLNRFKIRSSGGNVDAAETLRIVEVPSKGKPVAVVEEWGDRTGSKNDLLGDGL